MTYFNLIFITSSIFLSVITARHMVSTHGAKAVGASKEDVFQDYVLNFFGTILGWGAFYYLIFFQLGEKLEFIDLFLILVAFIGITGYLPHLIINKELKP